MSKKTPNRDHLTRISLSDVPDLWDEGKDTKVEDDSHMTRKQVLRFARISASRYRMLALSAGNNNKIDALMDTPTHYQLMSDQAATFADMISRLK